MLAAMQPLLYAHPFSSYCQKVLVAIYENDTPFTYRQLVPEDPSAFSELESLWPLKKMPLLVDEGRAVVESSVIIEHLMIHHPGPLRLIPENAADALEVRMKDRFFDNYVMAPMQAIVADFIRPPDERSPYTVAQSKALLDRAYRWLDAEMERRTWAATGGFSLADCAAAPALFFADWVHRIPTSFAHARAYRDRLLARPSFARAVNEARPYRPIFPPGAPDRD
jgi:glutathione S-transferase